MDFPEKIAELQLPRGSYVVVGSGILQALGIRTAEDIDLVVSEEVFERLGAAGWQPDDSGVEPRLRHGVYDAGTIWMGKPLADVLPEAVYIAGIPYASLAGVLEWKRRYRRDKDASDIDLIEAYLRSHPEFA